MVKHHLHTVGHHGIKLPDGGVGAMGDLSILGLSQVAGTHCCVTDQVLETIL